MKKVLLAVMVFCFMVSLAVAQGDTSAGATVTLNGDIIDNMCLGAHKPEELAEFVKGHGKQCAISPDCEKSGYSILSDGNLSKFDAESNAKIAEFLKKEDSKLQVVVTARKTGEEMSLVSIENQQ